VHLRAEGNGKLLNFILTPGQAHEAPVFDQLLQGGSVKRPGRGRPKRRPKRIAGDKGYSSRAIRATLRRWGIRVTIPHKSNEHRGPFCKELYKLRNRIERLINRLKQYRRIATRYEKHADNYRAMWLLAAILLWLGFADTP
jgi:transposase